MDVEIRELDVAPLQIQGPKSRDLVHDLFGPRVSALAYYEFFEAELGSNTWLTVPANPGIIFDTPIEQRWTSALGLPGVDIRRITQYAGHA